MLSQILCNGVTHVKDEMKVWRLFVKHIVGDHWLAFGLCANKCYNGDFMFKKKKKRETDWNLELNRSQGNVSVMCLHSSSSFSRLSVSTCQPPQTRLRVWRALVFDLWRVEGPLWRDPLQCNGLTAPVVTPPARALCCQESHVHVHVTEPLGRVGHRSINCRLMTFSGTRSVRVMGFTETPSGSGFTSNSIRILARAR